ncbi:InlB B-repeat-containing protein [Pseudogracilibacillus sp. SO30301A]|uniref:InlB B-repeat-containing protein n=1 Tax=Pseudogracilibacillus sp. SO30301A TaxID=3098291 RepID=UPI00300DC31D
MSKGFLVRFISTLTIFSFIFSFMPHHVGAVAHDPNDHSYDYGVRIWEDETPDIGFYINASARYTLETVQEPSMGTISGEWSVMNLLRGKYTGYDYVSHIPDDYFNNYIKRIEDYVTLKQGNLDRNKSTEWSRLILALSALDYDITNVSGYDFIDKLSASHRFSYRQGINGPIWEVIAMNTGNYDFYPYKMSDANTYGKMIDYILNLEIKQADGTTGGWALMGTIPDPDITAMALQALAPYYKNPEKYNKTDAETTYEEFEKAVERGIYTLSEIQADNGAFKAFGNVNAESTVQIIVALTALGIDPLTDNLDLNAINKNVSFHKGDGSIQDGVKTNNMIDALLTFWADGSGSERGVGGFKHVTTGFDGGESGYGVNAMATDQSLYGLIAYDRFIKSKNPLYDMTDMMPRHGGILHTEMKSRDVQIKYEITEELDKQFTVHPYEIITISEGEPIEGRQFVNWNSKADGSGTIYTSGEKLSMPDRDISLYAQYEAIPYNITYELNDGKFVNENIAKTYTVEEEIILPGAEDIEKSGHTFEGWYDNPSFEGEKVTSISTGNYGDKTFYAKWKELTDVDEEAVLAVEEMIAQLPSVNELTLEDIEKVEEARDAYNQLTNKEQELVSNSNKLLELEEKLSILIEEAKNQTAANKVIDLIDALPEIENITLDNKKAVEETRLAYNSLTEIQKQLVTNIEKLNALETEIEHLQAAHDLEKAQAVDQMIEQLPSLEELTLEYKDQIDKVRTAFYSLTPAQKERMENKELFEAIEAKWFELEQKEKDEIAANKVEMMIKGLPVPQDVNLDDKAAIQNVREAYDQLTTAQKELVQNLEKLEQVEVNLEKLEKELADQTAANEVMHSIDFLPEVDDITLEDKDEISLVREEFNQLTEDQKKLVTNEEKLLQLEAKIKELEEAKEQADKEAAQEVEEKISVLPTVEELSLTDQESVEAVRAAYDALTEKQQSLVTNVEKLDALELKITELLKLETDKKAAEQVEEKINTLPSINEVSLSDKAAVKDARSLFEKLTKDQKTLVSNIDTLVALENKMKELEEAKKDKEPTEPSEPKESKNEAVNKLGNDNGNSKKTGKEADEKDVNKAKGESANNNKIGSSDEEPEGKSGDPEKSSKLPKTATYTFTILLVGMLLIGLGSVLYYFRKKTA